MTAVRATAVAVNGRLAPLEKFIELCSSYRTELRRSIVTHRSILSPIRRLPNELLAEIFTAAVKDAFRGSDRLDCLSPWSQPPWTLARVCRRWAAIVLGTPSMWSRIFLNLDAIGAGPGAVALTELLHQRSGGLPLSITMNERYNSETRGVLDVVFTHCERWQHWELLVSRGSPLLLDIPTAHAGRLPNLTTLKIYAEFGPDDAEFESLAGFRNIFAIAPRLTAVYASFEDSNRVFSRPPLEFPWPQLTTLSIGLRFSEEALPLIPQLSTIVNLRVQCTKADPFPAQSPITLPHLRMLEVKAQYRSDPLRSLSLLGCLTTPLLEHLGVQDEATKDEILSLITRSRCKLKSFHFIHDTICPEDVLSLIREMSNLRELKMGDFAETSTPLSVPPVSIIQGLHSHWLAVRRQLGPGSRLSVCVVDDNRPSIDPDVISLMQKDGLFIDILPHVWQFDSLVDAKFDT
ncbi:hypothetical protein FB45DRAFT_1051184 [Roridomyces roridus]|uniref:F-box domain-containing protein n=1 Tax=Roridomyces roridus TaxID=1738132 RepID=A0AAD7CFL7_9AGAR|nr:hypothetical protein FB45DRAFT_1051184 [Roridomyces roridus]